MKNYQSKVTISISVIAIALSFIAILMNFEVLEMSTDAFIGIIIGVLALLVTVLIGWNIYSLIDLNETKRDINNIINDRVNLAKESALWEIYRTAFEMHARNPGIAQFSAEPIVRYGLLYLRSSMVLNMNEAISSVLAVFNSILGRMPEFIFENNEQIRIKAFLKEITKLNVIMNNEEVGLIIDLIKAKI